MKTACFPRFVMGGRQITWIFAIYFVGLDCFEPNSGGFMMVLRFSAEEMLQLLRNGKIISGCLGGTHFRMVKIELSTLK